MSAAPERPHSAGGFTLFEVLIAFFVISIGLVGVVSLQAMSKAAQHQAIQRSRAVMLADQMLEMIRSNPRGVGTYNIGYGANAVGGTSIEEEPTPNCTAAACTPDQLALHDLWLWEQALDGAAVTAADGGGTGAGIIEPRGCIAFTADAGRANTGIVNVVIQWRGLQETTDAIADTTDTPVCGSDFGADDAGFRRQVVLSSYVIDEVEL